VAWHVLSDSDAYDAWDSNGAGSGHIDHCRAGRGRRRFPAMFFQAKWNKPRRKSSSPARRERGSSELIPRGAGGRRSRSSGCAQILTSPGRALRNAAQLGRISNAPVFTTGNIEFSFSFPELSWFKWRRISNGSNSFVCNTPHFQAAFSRTVWSNPRSVPPRCRHL
jgi:hypothetical protein